LTNFTSGIAQCMAAGIPAVGIIAESGTEDDDLAGSQGFARSEDQFRSISKWARRVPNPNTLLFQIKRAFRSSVTPPTGPCIVSYTSTTHGGTVLPKDQAYTNFTPGWKPKEWMPLANPADVQELMKWLLEAEKPVMIVGHVAHQDDCQDEVREFVQLLGLPCNPRRVARGMISELEPLNYQKARGRVIAQADRCLVFGIRVGSFLEGFGAPPYYPEKMRYAQVHNTPDMTCLKLNTDVEVIGHLKMVLQQMIQAAKDMGIKGPPEKWAKWRQFVAETVAAGKQRFTARTKGQEDKMPVHPDIFSRYCSELLNDKYNNDYIAIIDGFTASTYFTNWNIAVNTGTVLDAAETIGIGHGPGMALGAGLYTKRQKPIIVPTGDGAIGTGSWDIDTCVRWGIPAVFIHQNNNTIISGFFKYFMAKAAKPTGNYLRDSWEIMPDVRYDEIFAKIGCHTEFIEKAAQTKPALERAIETSLKEQKPSFVEVFVDPMVISDMFTASPMMALFFTSQLKWDELPDDGQKLIASLMTHEALPMFPKDYQEGLTAMMKK